MTGTLHTVLRCFSMFYEISRKFASNISLRYYTYYTYFQSMLSCFSENLSISRWYTKPITSKWCLTVKHQIFNFTGLFLELRWFSRYLWTISKIYDAKILRKQTSFRDNRVSSITNYHIHNAPEKMSIVSLEPNFQDMWKSTT